MADSSISRKVRAGGGEIFGLSPWACMYFTRHAKNRARWFGMSLADAERVIERPEWVDLDEDGLPRYTGYVGELRVRIVVALDDPELIVTIHKRGK